MPEDPAHAMSGRPPLPTPRPRLNPSGRSVDRGRSQWPERGKRGAVKGNRVEVRPRHRNWLHRRSTAALTELRRLGVRIAVDEFGTGYSSLSHLQRFPVDELKVDKSFVAPLHPSEPDSTALVTSIIELAHRLGLAVVAEGIETEEQLAQLAEARAATSARDS